MVVDARIIIYLGGLGGCQIFGSPYHKTQIMTGATQWLPTHHQEPSTAGLWQDQERERCSHPSEACKYAMPPQLPR